MSEIEKETNGDTFCIYCEKEIIYKDEAVKVFVGVNAYEHINCNEKSGSRSF